MRGERVRVKKLVFNMKRSSASHVSASDGRPVKLAVAALKIIRASQAVRG